MTDSLTFSNLLSSTSASNQSIVYYPVANSILFANLSQRRLKTGQTNKPTTIANNESRTPSPLLGEGPIIFAKSKPDSIESSQSANPPLSTPATIPRATFSAAGNRCSSCATDPVEPLMCFVRCGLLFCSARKAGEMKLEGKAQWMVYVDAGPDSRSASMRSVSAKPRTAHFAALR